MNNIPKAVPLQFPNNPLDFQKSVENFSRITDKAFKDIFKGEIRGSFLIEIMSKVNTALGPYLFQLYDFNLNNEKLATGFGGTFEYEICKIIIGIHHADTVFLTEDEIRAKRKDEKYKDDLIRQAVYHIFSRKYAAAFFRTKSIMLAERFNFYPVPYMTFFMCMRMTEQFMNQSTKLAGLVSQIIKKAIAALTLLEDGLLDSAYMPCRTVIELYLKYMLLRDNAELTATVEKFSYFDLDKTNCSKQYSNDFNELFAKRKNRFCKNKVDYLHYGFVDYIDGYHEIVKQNPYSTSGIFTYLKETADDEQFKVYYRLENFYKSCHGYIHGNVPPARFPLLNYFEISLILGFVIPRIYKILCEESNKDVELYAELDEKYQFYFNQLKEQYKNRSTEKFEAETAKYTYQGV